MRSSVTRGAGAASFCAALSGIAALCAGCGSSAPARGQTGSGGAVAGSAGGHASTSTGGMGMGMGGQAGSSANGGSGGEVGARDAGGAQGGTAGEPALPDSSAFCSSQATPTCAQGGCATPPSCASAGPGRSDCGANGASKESCCTSLEVPCGAHFRTYTNDGTGAMGQGDPAIVSGFRLDKYLVTVGRFRQFVQAWNGGSGYAPAAGSGKHTYLNGGKGLADAADSADGGAPMYEPGWVTAYNSNVMLTSQNLACDPMFATWTDTPGSNETLPMNCVNWYEAYAFCIWDGGFLPSEAEFEYAAAGGGQQREYPWGSTDPGASNDYAIFGCDRDNDGGGCTGIGSLAPVGTATLGAARWGQLDLAGDLSEWLLDVYAPFGNPCTDCTALAGVNRGGSFRSTPVYLQSSFRGDLLYATDQTSSFGIRCTRTP